MNLGPVLKEIRSSKGLSLREVEQATGVSNAYLSQLENGKVRKPSLFFIHKLARVYGWTIDELLDAAGFEKPGFLRKGKSRDDTN